MSSNGKPSYKPGDRVRPSEAGRFLLGPTCAGLGKVGTVVEVRYTKHAASASYLFSQWAVQVRRDGSAEARWYRADLWESTKIECQECGTWFEPMTDAFKCPECGAENYPDEEATP